MSQGLLLSLPDALSLYSMAVEVATAALELVAKLAISLNQVPRFNRSGRTGSGFHITWAGTGSFRNSSFFMMTHTGLFIVSGLGDLLGNAGGQMLQGTLFTPLERLPIGQLMLGGYKGLLLYNNASSAANLVSSGCLKGWYRYGKGGNSVLGNFRCSESWFSRWGRPEAVDMGGTKLRGMFGFSRWEGDRRGEMEKPNLGSFFRSGFGFRLGRYL